jgi:hypothetical protein
MIYGFTVKKCRLQTIVWDIRQVAGTPIKLGDVGVGKINRSVDF